MEIDAALEAKSRALGIGQVQRHIFLCVGPDCCSTEQGQATWEFLKARLKAESRSCGVYRTKAACLRLCMQGPIAVVYPEGTWYRNVTVDVCRQIVEQHLLGGKVVQEFVFASNPLEEMHLPVEVECPCPAPETDQ